MRAVSVREFSYNPSATFVRVEKGETIRRRPECLRLLLVDRYSESDWEREFRAELEAKGEVTGEAEP